MIFAGGQDGAFVSDDLSYNIAVEFDYSFIRVQSIEPAASIPIDKAKGQV